MNRLHALTDGVYAIVLTLLVLELKIPEGLPPDRILPALIENAPRFYAFAIAFSPGESAAAMAVLSHARRSPISSSNRRRPSAVNVIVCARPSLSLRLRLISFSRSSASFSEPFLIAMTDPVTACSNLDHTDNT